MLKHVASNSSVVGGKGKPRDTVSLNSTGSSTGSTGPPDTLSSRSSSSSSLHDAPTIPKTVVKVYAKDLCTDVEYKTLSITSYTTSRDVVRLLLNKFRKKNRDPNLFFLTMEIWTRNTGVPVKSLLALDDDARPAELQACHPRGDTKFFLRMRKGGLVKIYDSCLMSGSLYKSLLISDRTTVDELIQLLLSCYNSPDLSSKFELYEICINSKYERKLYPNDLPLLVQLDWPMPSQMAFQLRRKDSRNSKNGWNSFKELPHPVQLKPVLYHAASSRSMPGLFSSSLSTNKNNTYENYFYI